MTSAIPQDTGIVVHNLNGIPAVTFTRKPPRGDIGTTVRDAIKSAMPNSVHDNAK